MHVAHKENKKSSVRYKIMIIRPKGAKTWVGQSEIFFFFFFSSLFGLIFLSFECLIFFFLNLKQTVDFKIFGSVAKGNTTFFFYRPNGDFLYSAHVCHIPGQSW